MRNSRLVTILTASSRIRLTDMCLYPFTSMSVWIGLMVLCSNYVNSTTAKNNDLVQVCGTNFTMRADDQAVPAASARGRDSVRITSQKSYSTHVAV